MIFQFPHRQSSLQVVQLRHSCCIFCLFLSLRPGQTRLRVVPTLIHPHQLSSTLNWFKFWWELMRVCARLINHESWWELQNYYRFTLCSSRLSKIVQNLQLRKITSFAWVTGRSTLINSHLVWPVHESWGNSRTNSRFSTLIYSHPRLTRPLAYIRIDQNPQGPVVRKVDSIIQRILG